jgi:hypothetical protein
MINEHWLKFIRKLNFLNFFTGRRGIKMITLNLWFSAAALLILSSNASAILFFTGTGNPAIEEMKN